MDECWREVGNCFLNEMWNFRDQFSSYSKSKHRGLHPVRDDLQRRTVQCACMLFSSSCRTPQQTTVNHLCHVARSNAFTHSTSYRDGIGTRMQSVDVLSCCVGVVHGWSVCGLRLCM